MFESCTWDLAHMGLKLGSAICQLCDFEQIIYALCDKVSLSLKWVHLYHIKIYNDYIN